MRTVHHRCATVRGQQVSYGEGGPVAEPRAGAAATEVRPAVEFGVPATGAVVLLGSIEAVEVNDGRLTTAVRLGRSGERIALRVPAPLWSTVRHYLCHQVAACGHLRRDQRTGRLVLDLVSVDPLEL